MEHVKRRDRKKLYEGLGGKEWVRITHYPSSFSLSSPSSCEA